MENELKKDLNEVYAKSRLIWFAVLAGMISLIILVIVFHVMGLIENRLTSQPQMYNQLFLMIVFLLAFLIIILKRMFFIPSRIVAAARRKARSRNIEDSKEGRRTILNFALERIRVLRLVLWIMADLIMITGFVSYLFLLSFQTFIIYSVVGLYSLLINFPNYALLEQCYQQLMPGEED